MSRLTIAFLTLLCFHASAFSAESRPIILVDATSTVTITGALRQWHKVTLTLTTGTPKN